MQQKKRINLSRIALLIFFSIITLLFSSQDYSFAGLDTVDYLCDLGVTFYNLQRYDDALSEFNKVLILDPYNKTAQKYINQIFQKEKINEVVQETVSTKTPPKEEITQNIGSLVKESNLSAVPIATSNASSEEYGIGEDRFAEQNNAREQTIENTLNNLGNSKKQDAPVVSSEKKKYVPASEDVKKDKQKNNPILSGEVELRMGLQSNNDVVWKRANWDLNEKNYRILSNVAFDRKENTYDPRIYDRFKLKLDTNQAYGLGFYTDITVDPWSFRGKSAKQTIKTTFDDFVETELKYWANTGYTINETVYSSKYGNTFALPEIKVSDGSTNVIRVKGGFSPADTLRIPVTKIKWDFVPLRQFWFDYKNDNVKVRLYPIAYENQALTFDDPLVLSNKRIWWEDSPWIRKWTSGIENYGNDPIDFKKGYWDKTLSFFARDSEGQRLTGLRGVNFDFVPNDQLSVVSGFASAKGVWQDYSQIDNFITASRAKYLATDNLSIAGTFTTRFGYNTDRKEKLDATNYVYAADASYEITDGILLSTEYAQSRSHYDLTSGHFNTEKQGNAYYVSLMGRYPFEQIIETRYGYNGIVQQEGEGFFNKFRLFASRMDKSFDQPLSSFVETRDDEFWSRHLHFRRPFKHYYQGEGQLLGWDDVKTYAVGDGIDADRTVIGLRLESSLWDRKVENFLDARNVHEATRGKFIENVFRDEASWNVNDRLTAKFLSIYHRLHKTYGGIDPFVFDTTTGRLFSNSIIEDAKDPSVATGSLGLEYKFFEWLALNGIWEYTNDISAGYDNFPRGILNSGANSYIYYENDNKYRDSLDWLYDQQHFPKPPYPYFNVFKSGLRFTPVEKLDIYLDYTRNPYQKAGQVDDNMNHMGFEIAYTPLKKLSFFIKYTYSRWQDLDKLIQNINKVYGHHNAFFEMIYRMSDNEDFSFQYGEASRDPYMGGVLDIGWDPYGGSLRTIDTVHIFRFYYRRKF